MALITCKESRKDHTYIAGVAKLVDAPDLGSGALKAWGFESLHPHHNRKSFSYAFLDIETVLVKHSNH